ncbi:MAG: methylmalonyl-CoA mutase family protein [Thermodesulfobacteriota bacterium]
MSENEALRQWLNGELARTLRRFPERRESFSGHGGREIERLAVPAVIDDAYLENLGFPGSYPFTRGVQPTMYRGRLWTMRQYAGFSTARATNERFRYLLAHGTTGLSVAFDLPTQIGYDSDHPMSSGEVGKVGVAIDTLADMELLFDGIPLGEVSTSMTINAPAAVLLAMYVALAEKQGVAPEQIRGTIQNDVLKEYVARGTYIFPPRPSLRLIADIFAWCGERAPAFNTISISGYHIREAGATAAQEIALTLANGCTYVETAVAAGLDVDDFAKRLSFFFNASNDFLEEVAKFRAARRLWARLMKERFNARHPASMMLRFHTQTAGNSLTAQQVDNNIVRVTIQALAAVLGGTQSLHTCSKDEALALPTEDSVRTALRTQQIIAHESGVAGTVDPLGGSWFIENLTDRLEAEARELMARIDAGGGVVAGIESGFIKRQIENAAYEFQCGIESGERIVVGVNAFQVEEEARPATMRIDPAVEAEQVKGLAAVRVGRDGAAVAASLALVERAARDEKVNLMPAIMAAVQAYASIGEICGVLRGVFGEYRDGGR